MLITDQVQEEIAMATKTLCASGGLRCDTCRTQELGLAEDLKTNDIEQPLPHRCGASATLTLAGLFTILVNRQRSQTSREEKFALPDGTSLASLPGLAASKLWSGTSRRNEGSRPS